ncbi:hypothetical protein AYI70_g5130 [Smittium culicis]|uniref:Uncharacterized protein n=1 Tax=Smittium culicis TaxID=133412 RepID=A0A1R1XVY1_9FUNG|nr:hypothetical protein AYI70_g5130 [Smittium culicis]
MVPGSTLDCSFFGNDNVNGSNWQTLRLEDAPLIVHAMRHQYLLFNSEDCPLLGFGPGTTSQSSIAG